MDLTGKTFGSWSIIGRGRRTAAHVQLWIARCACGVQREVYKQPLVRGESTSCGCQARARNAAAHTRHGHASGQRTPEYRSWTSMIARCGCPTATDYSDYGGRGITVCDRWRTSFENFLADMGPRPKGTTLDRIDVNGNYEPGNCRWSTAIDQAMHRRDNTILTYDGRSLTLAEWARRTGIQSDTIGRRLERGWSIARALTEPPRQRKTY